MAKTLVLFDFDGTITKKDTFLELIKHINGTKAFYIGMARFFPLLLLYKAGVVSGQKMKEKVMTFFWKGLDENIFSKKCKDFAEKKLPSLLRERALEQIKYYLAGDSEVAVVSASGEEWVKPFCDAQSMICVATLLEKKRGKLTGKLAGNNCNGNEKVERIKKTFNLNGFEQIIAYGDTNGDKPMLNLASTSFYKPFRDKNG